MSGRRVSRVFAVVVAIALFSGLFSASAFAGVTRYEEYDPTIVYTPPGLVANSINGWFFFANALDSGSPAGYRYNTLVNATASFTFTGTGIDWRSVKATNCGIAEVWITGQTPELANLYAASTQRQALIWSKTGLPYGTYTLNIRNTGTSDPPSGVRNIGIDYFEVYTPSDIVASAGPNGSISPAGTTSVDHGAGQTYTITADPGYHIADVLVDGSSVGAVPSYAFTNVTSPRTISASFAADAPVVSTPASSPWSLALGALAGACVVAVMIRRRSVPMN